MRFCPTQYSHRTEPNNYPSLHISTPSSDNETIQFPTPVIVAVVAASLRLLIPIARKLPQPRMYVSQPHPSPFTHPSIQRAGQSLKTIHCSLQRVSISLHEAPPNFLSYPCDTDSVSERASERKTISIFRGLLFHRPPVHSEFRVVNSLLTSDIIPIIPKLSNQKQSLIVASLTCALILFLSTPAGRLVIRKSYTTTINCDRAWESRDLQAAEKTKLITHPINNSKTNMHATDCCCFSNELTVVAAGCTSHHHHYHHHLLASPYYHLPVPDKLLAGWLT